MTQEEIDTHLSDDQSWIPQGLRDIGVINEDGSFREPPRGPLQINLSDNKFYLKYTEAKRKQISLLMGENTPEEDISEDFNTYVDKLYKRKESAKMDWAKKMAEKPMDDDEDILMPWDIEELEENKTEEPTVELLAESQKSAMAALMEKYEAPKEKATEESVKVPETEPIAEIQEQAVEEKPAEPVAEESVTEKAPEVPEKKAAKKKKTEKKSVELPVEEVTTHHTAEEIPKILDDMLLTKTDTEFRARQREIDDIISKLVITPDMPPDLIRAKLTDINQLMASVHAERVRANMIMEAIFDKEGQLFKAASLNREGNNEVERKQSETRFLMNYPWSNDTLINAIELREVAKTKQTYYNNVWDTLSKLQTNINSVVSVLKTEAMI